MEAGGMRDLMHEGGGMRDLIHVINSVQEVLDSCGVDLGLELPRIAVVGGQSAGKSSVLECFVGRDFLPRGSGIVTRRPLVLQLHHSQGEERATFLHTGETAFRLGEEVRREIVAETDRETGDNRGISSKPIHLRVYSPNVLDLTLVDLPGITKVAVGDQPEDIEQQVRDMILQYISEDNTIILAVSPANQDIANSDALKLAREVDRAGDRTIGVITKLDLMDRGTDARNILENKVLPLKKGYIGVVNRSQHDIDTATTISTALSAEQQFFLAGPYRDIAARQGSKYLQEVLHKELGNHIRTKVPSIRSQLLRKEQETEAELKELGYEKDGDSNKGKLVYKLVTMFGDRLQGNIDGEGRDVDMEEVSRGAVINRKFYKDFSEVISAAFSPHSSMLDKEISVAVANLHGTNNALFVPERAFTRIVVKLVSRYRSPLAQCVSIIRAELEEVVRESLARVLANYPVLREEVRRLLDLQLVQGEARTVVHLDTYLAAQKSFMNTRHPDFGLERQPKQDSLVKIPNKIFEETREQKQVPAGVWSVAPTNGLPPPATAGRPGSSPMLSPKLSRAAPAVPPKVKTAQKDKDKDRAAILGSRLIQEQTSSLKEMVEQYMEITDIAIRDIVPKYIMHSLVHALQDYVRDSLLGDLLEARTSVSSQEELVERVDSSGRIPHLLAALEAARRAGQILAKIHL